MVSPVVALQQQTNVPQLIATDKDALEIGDDEHASHARTCSEQSPTLLALRRESACAI